MIPRLTRSWCGCSLETGTKIISIYSLLSKLFAVSLLSVACANFPDGPHDDVYQATIVLLVAFLVASIMRLITAVLLILGVYTLHDKLAYPWIVVDMISRVIDISLFVAALVLKDIRVAIISPIRIGFGLYFWLIVYNYFRELREGILLGTNRISVVTEEDPLLRN